MTKVKQNRKIQTKVFQSQGNHCKVTGPVSVLYLIMPHLHAGCWKQMLSELTSSRLSASLSSTQVTDATQGYSETRALIQYKDVILPV